MMSSHARKQRKALYEAPMHKRQSLMGSHLTEKLRKEFGRRSIPVRTGDKVKITSGEFRGLIGDVKEIDLKRLRVFVENISRKKVDGTDSMVPLHPSNLEIIEANMEDKQRQDIVKRSGGKIIVTGATKEAEKKDTKKEAPKEVEEKAEFKCPVCKETLSSKTAVDQHVQKEHADYR